jgi:surface protein
MSYMFYGASAFNQNIGGWDVSAVTNMNLMFYGASAFNNGGSSDIGNWTIKNDAPVNMGSMFSGASAFNQNIGGWDVSAVTNMGAMFLSSGLSDANYDLLLVGWTGWTGGAATKSLQNSVPFHAGTAKYSTGDPADARAWLVDTILNGGKAWTITDGGPV